MLPSGFQEDSHAPLPVHRPQTWFLPSAQPVFPAHPPARKPQSGTPRPPPASSTLIRLFPLPGKKALHHAQPRLLSGVNLAFHRGEFKCQSPQDLPPWVLSHRSSLLPIPPGPYHLYWLCSLPVGARTNPTPQPHSPLLQAHSESRMAGPPKRSQRGPVIPFILKPQNNCGAGLAVLHATAAHSPSGTASTPGHCLGTRY